uniref:F5/8 type C domain-containing protein n=1 Tax=Branchiostoma floridae TaxID=7739 RepID=C3ZUI9_BRAFL|eukprot:XP_002587817.1 hypothetical protein BRAFLDRAFT_92266 [Branchiostoma floridae]
MAAPMFGNKNFGQDRPLTITSHPELRHTSRHAPQNKMAASMFGNKNFGSKSNTVCTVVEFQCENSGSCVTPSGVCNGLPDCGDASDELLCQSCAEKGLWQCDSAMCINNASLECDGKCLPKYRACNGIDDCTNGEDEINCTSGGCGARQFPCEDGTCLLESQLCDNLTDCSGGEDEEDCGDVLPPGFPLGLTSRYIPDVFINASSEYKPEFAASQVRHTGYCWVPLSVVDQWLQVYFGKTTDVTGVVISGGGANWDLGSWVTSFTLAFSMDGASWAPYEGHSNSVQVFQGNRDRYNRVSRPLPTGVTSRYIRLYPTGFEGWVAMVMEVYVTNDEDNWLENGEYVPLGVGLDLNNPAVAPKIPDLYMTASSREEDFFPWLARLNNGAGQQQGAYWVPIPWGNIWLNIWLQIKHSKLYKVAGVVTQGAYNRDCWVTSYRLEFSVNGQTWRPYTNGTGGEIDSQFLPCGDDVSPGDDTEVFHESEACDGIEDCPSGKDEDCDGEWLIFIHSWYMLRTVASQSLAH